MNDARLGKILETMSKMPTRRRAYLRGPDLKPVRDLLMVAIHLSGFSFS